MDLEQYEHFNSSGHLPPVGSPLIIKVEGEYRMFNDDGEEASRLEKMLTPPHKKRVTRVAHIERRDDEMSYEADDGSVYFGRFAWTHP